MDEIGPRVSERPRNRHRRPFPPHRRMVIDAMRAGRRSFPVHGLLEVDVTDAVAALEAHDPPVSFTAFIVAATGRAVAAHPNVHAYRNWRGRLVTHEHVDVATLIEVEHGGSTLPLAHVLRDADVRSVEALSSELRGVAADVGRSESGRLLEGRAAGLTRIPGLMPLVYRALGRSERLRERSGTVAVTSVGMFGSGGGAGIAQPTIMTLSVLVGGRSRRPRVVGDEIVPRLVLDLTISVDHAIVDGAPAARFANTLVEVIEDPRWVDGS